MKKQKGSILQRMTAVLLAAVLVVGMAWDAAPISVLAQESVSENTPEPVEGETKPAQGEDSGEQKDPEKAEGGEETEQEPPKQDDGTGEETTQPGGGAEQETPTDDGKEEAQEPGSVSDNDTPTESVSENDAGDENSENLQALLARIAALPDAEEYLATEPDVDGGEADEDAYEQWLAELYAYAEEALAIQEEIEELSEEEQAQIPEEALAKLAAWMEIAQTAGESAQVMAAYKEMHTHKICAGSSCVDGSHEDVEWIPLTFTGGKMYAGEEEIKWSNSGYQLPDGNYYLPDNLTIENDQICIDQADVHLCLNGKTLSFGKSAVWIYGGKLTLCDCAGNGAINAAKQAAVGIANISSGKRAFIMYGGSLQGSGCDFEARDHKKAEAKFLGGNVDTIKVKLSRDYHYSPDSTDEEVVLITPIFIGQPVKTGTKIEVDFNWWEEYDGELSDVPVVRAAEGYTFTEADLANLDIEVIASGYTDTKFQKKIQNGTIVLCQHKHVLTKHEAVPATCEKQGTGEYWKCEGTDGCGKMFSDAAGTSETTPDSVKIAALGHDWGEWKVTKPATATKQGEKERTCKRCNEKETETIPKTGGGSKPGGGDQNDDGQGGNNSNDGGNGSGSSGGDQGGGNNAGNAGGTGAGMPKAPGASGTGKPKVKQEKEGNIKKEVRVEGEETLDAAVETPLSELADIVLTKEEKQKAADGTNIRIVLEVKNAFSVVSAADKALVEAALNGSLAKGYTLGQYLDIDLYKLIGNSRSDITETDRKITVTIQVPDSLKNTNGKTRTFAVIRVHGGKAELLADLDNNADTVTIATDRFSTYAVVYKDTAGKNSVVRISVEDGGKKSGGARDDEPETGDNAPLELCATLSMIAGFAYLLLYFTDRERGMTEETKKELVSRLVAWAKQGGRIRRWLALAAIFVLLVYYHSIGKKTCTEWKAIYGE